MSVRTNNFANQKHTLCWTKDERKIHILYICRLWRLDGKHTQSKHNKTAIKQKNTTTPECGESWISNTDRDFHVRQYHFF